MDNWINTINRVVIQDKLHPIKATAKSKMSLLVYRRFKVQQLLNNHKLDKMFFPTIDQENLIRRERETDVVQKENIAELISVNKLDIPRVNTLFGNDQVDRNKLPQGLYELILENEKKVG